MCKSSTLSSMRLLANLLHRIYIYIYILQRPRTFLFSGREERLTQSIQRGFYFSFTTRFFGREKKISLERERKRKKEREGREKSRQASKRARTRTHTHCSPLSATRYEIALSGSPLSTREKVFPSSFGGVWRGMAGELGGGRGGRGQHVTLFIGGGRRGMESHVSREIIGLCERVDKWSTAYGASRTTEARFRFHHPLPVIYPHHGGSILFHSALATLGFP